MKSKSIITGMLALAVFVALPTSLFASTYAYVNTSGSVQYVTADNSAQAILVNNISSTSGVMLVTVANVVPTAYVTTPTVSFGQTTYAYVNVNGNVQYVAANSAAQAMLVNNISSTSGVMAV